MPMKSQITMFTFIFARVFKRVLES